MTTQLAEERMASALTRLADATERIADAAEANAEVAAEVLTYWRAREARDLHDEARDLHDVAIRDQGDAITVEQLRVSLAMWEQHRDPP